MGTFIAFKSPLWGREYLLSLSILLRTLTQTLPNQNVGDALNPAAYFMRGKGEGRKYFSRFSVPDFTVNVLPGIEGFFVFRD